MTPTFRSAAQNDAPLSVTPVKGMRETLEFVRYPRELYKNDSNYRSLPDLVVLKDLFPRTNPWFEHGEAQLFVARRGNKIVGRLTAHIDQEHLKYHNDKTGFFGFFECENDPQTAKMLLGVAEDWCKKRGMEHIRGPFSFSTNQSCGTLVDGFDTPNYIMMPHGRRYYQELFEAAGYANAMDMYSWRYVREDPAEQVQQIADAVAQHPGLVVRQVDMKDLEKDIGIIMDIFNDAWAKNWGYVPMTESELRAMVSEFRLIADPAMCLIAEVDGKPAAMCVALPNLHEVSHAIDGKLFPLGLAKAAYHLKVKRPKTFRQVLLGVKREYRGSSLGGLSLLLYVTIHRNAKARGYVEAEASWTLANNDKINFGMSFMGAEHYKTQRVYEKGLQS